MEPKDETLKAVSPVLRRSGNPVPSWLPATLPDMRLQDFPFWSGRSRPAPPPPRERHDGLDIFVGGLFDDLPLARTGVTRDYAKTYAKETGRPTRYFGNARVDEVLGAIRDANATGGPVDVVGHSYGGPDAYSAAVRARREGLRVDNLLTLDPVTAFFAKPQKGRAAGSWINVKAVTDRPNTSDRITHIPVLSENPSRLPTGVADRHASVEAHHEDVESMMRHGGARGILDASRQLPAPVLSDKQPINDWMKARAVGAHR